MKSTLLVLVCTLLSVAGPVAAQDEDAPKIALLGGQEFVGREFHPQDARFAPDGKGFYFIGGEKEPYQVWHIAAAGGKPERVTDLPQAVSWLDVSPDGKRIVIEIHPPDEPDQCDVAVIGSDGKGFTIVAGDPKLDEGQPAWHPSGAAIIFKRLPPTKTADTPTEWILAQPKGKVLKTYSCLGKFGYPVFSGDGNWVITERGLGDRGGEIIRLRLPQNVESLDGVATGAEKAQFEVVRSFPDEKIYEPHPSPDGKRIAFILERDDEHHAVLLFESETGHIQTWLVALYQTIWFTDWSRDSRSALIFSTDGKDFAGQVLPAPAPLPPAKSSPLLTGPIPDGTLLWLRWLPMAADLYAQPWDSPFYSLEASRADGSALGVLEEDVQGFNVTGGGRYLIASIGNRAQDGNIHVKMSLRDLRSGESRMLGDADIGLALTGGEDRKIYDGLPGWPIDVTADGKRRACMCSREGVAQFEIADLDGGKVESRNEIGHGMARFSAIRWSPQGDRLAFEVQIGGFGNLLVGRPGDKAPLQEPYRCTSFLWEPSGTKGYFFRSEEGHADHACEIVEVTVPEGKTRVVLAGGANLARRSLGWNEPGKSLIFLEEPSGSSALTGGQETKVVTVALDGAGRKELCAGRIFAIAKHTRKPLLALLRFEPPKPGQTVAPGADGTRGVVVVRNLQDGTEKVVADDLAVGSHLAYFALVAQRIGMSPAAQVPAPLAWKEGE